MKTCTLILMGGSFRLGGQTSTSIGEAHSYAGQKEACLSHLAYCKHLENTLGVKPKIFINTYHSQYYDEMVQWYSSEYPVVHRAHTTMMGYVGLMTDTLSHVSLEDDDEFVLFVRIDLLLKPAFFDVTLGNELCFSSVCWTRFHMHNGVPRVADLMLFIPKRLLYLVREKRLSLCHEAYDYFLNQGLEKKDIGFFVDTFHDSDSEKDWNPLYKIVNRRETTHWHDRGRKISEVFAS